MAQRYPDVHPDHYEQHTFYVDSRVKGRNRGPYRVVLNAYSWNGWCSCWDFYFNKEKHLSKGAFPSEELRCFHIKRARAYWVDVLGPMVDKLLKERHEATPQTFGTGVQRRGSRVYHLRTGG